MGGCYKYSLAKIYYEGTTRISLPNILLKRNFEQDAFRKKKVKVNPGVKKKHRSFTDNFLLLFPSYRNKSSAILICEKSFFCFF